MPMHTSCYTINTHVHACSMTTNGQSFLSTHLHLLLEPWTGMPGSLAATSLVSAAQRARRTGVKNKHAEVLHHWLFTDHKSWPPGRSRGWAIDQTSSFWEKGWVRGRRKSWAAQTEGTGMV